MKCLRMPLLLILLALSSACATEPWVKPYERANLSDPIMGFARDPVSASFLHHVYDSREGARGAGVVSGGGCGCN